VIAAALLAVVVVAQSPSVVVDARYAGKDGARVVGLPTYRSIGAALAAAPARSPTPFHILIRKGRYYEKLSVDKPNIQFLGESRDSTVLTYNAAAGHRSPSGEPWTTHGSFTLRVTAPDFHLRNMTVENAFDYMANYAKPNTDTTKLVGSQGVAVMLAPGSDRAHFANCTIAGHQDTLFADAGRAYFVRCIITGSVDFIFGAGRAVFHNVDIISRDRGSQSNNGYVTAPSTPISQPYGFLFVDCRLRRETPAMAHHTVTLGRPWHPVGDPNAIGSVVFNNCWMDHHIGAKGWESMYSTNAAGVRTLHRPEDARFLEYRTRGPGAMTSATRWLMTSAEAANYTIARVLGDWNVYRTLSSTDPIREEQPIIARLRTHRGELLAESKTRLRAGDAELLPALRKLTSDADSVFKLGPYTVTAKRRTPPSGDKRDYMSFAPYWWPDSTKADGLPYIRRDGVFNMELRSDSDVLRWYALTDAVETLAHAYYFTDRAEYAHRALYLLRTWFLNDSTRMNPHLRYGQAIPGVTEGRGIGIIDTRDLGRLTDAVRILEASGAWNSRDTEGIRAWMSQYLQWLLTSQHGKDEAVTQNNHGTWYDVQIATLALFTGDTALARMTIERSKELRIAKQIDQEGKQPLELARTRSLHYSVENLDGMSRLAELAHSIGIDLWNWSDSNSGGIRKALEFVAPYADPQKKWPYEQITDEPPDLFILLLLRARHAYGDPAWSAHLQKLPTDLLRTHRAQLLYPEPK
jgi:pectinesterase